MITNPTDLPRILSILFQLSESLNLTPSGFVNAPGFDPHRTQPCSTYTIPPQPFKSFRKVTLKPVGYLSPSEGLGKEVSLVAKNLATGAVFLLDTFGLELSIGDTN